MGPLMEYRGYLGQIELDPAADVWRGRVVNAREAIRFRGRSPKELRADLARAVEEYVALCHRRGRSPERPCSGRFLVRLAPTLHRQAIDAATRAGTSLNGWVTGVISAAVEKGRR